MINLILTAVKRKRFALFILTLSITTAALYGCKFNNTTLKNPTGNKEQSNESYIDAYSSSVGTGDESKIVILPTVVADGSKEAPEGFKNVVVTFNDNNPIKLSLFVPSGWTLIPDNENNAGIGNSLGHIVNIQKDSVSIGVIGNDTFKINDDMTYGMIYAPIMGIHVNWLFEYNEISKTEKSSTAITKCYTWWNENDYISGYQEYSTGIVSYDMDLLKYIGLNFDEGLLTDAHVRIIADSVKLSAVNN